MQISSKRRLFQERKKGRKRKDGCRFLEKKNWNGKSVQKGQVEVMVGDFGLCIERTLCWNRGYKAIDKLINCRDVSG